MEKRFKRSLREVEKVFEFIDEFVKRSDVDEDSAFGLSLAVEELFTNMVKYNADNKEDILITLMRAEDELIVRMSEFNTKGFDIRKAKKYDTTRTLTDRETGGIGVHLATQYVDRIEYEYGENKAVITLVKKLRRTNV
ncbi:MAG: ATP-binding protein [Calditrichaceae bacterium]